MTDLLFVFGTLRRGLLPIDVIHDEQEFRFLGNGTVRGELFDLGEYPDAKQHVRAWIYLFNGPVLPAQRIRSGNYVEHLRQQGRQVGLGSDK